MADFSEIAPGWVKLLFKDIPEFGTFDLIQDPKDNEDPYYIFYNIPFEELEIGKQDRHSLLDIAINPHAVRGDKGSTTWITCSPIPCKRH